jgi:hypothetical protein
MRAIHQVLDSKPLVLEDEPIVDLLGSYYVERASRATMRFKAPGARMLRSHVVLRSRYTEDRLARGVAQSQTASTSSVARTTCRSRAKPAC